MFDPSMSFLDGFYWIFREAIGFDVFLALFAAGYWLLDRHWKKRKGVWPEPFFLLYSLLPLAVGLASAFVRCGYERLKDAFSGPAGHPYWQFANTRYLLMIAMAATLPVLLIRLFHSRGVPSQETAGGIPSGCRLPAAVSMIATLSTLALMAGDVLFFNFLNLLIPMDSSAAAADRFIARAGIPQQGMLVASIVLLALLLPGMVLCQVRSSRCRPTQRQVQALFGTTILLIGAILIFIAYCISQSWTLSRVVIPF